MAKTGFASKFCVKGAREPGEAKTRFRDWFDNAATPLRSIQR